MIHTRKKGLYPALSLLLALIALPAGAEIYKWTDARGNVHFSDTPPARVKARAVELKSSINSYNGNALPKFQNTSRTDKTPVRGSGNTLPKLRPRQVIMYSAEWCGFCKKAKAYFKQKGIAYAERDIDKSTQAKKEYQSLGGGGIPLILVGNKNGTQKISGFSSARFDAAYH